MRALEVSSLSIKDMRSPTIFRQDPTVTSPAKRCAEKIRTPLAPDRPKGNAEKVWAENLPGGSSWSLPPIRRVERPSTMGTRQAWERVPDFRSVIDDLRRAPVRKGVEDGSAPGDHSAWQVSPDSRPPDNFNESCAVFRRDRLTGQGAPLYASRRPPSAPTWTRLSCRWPTRISPAPAPPDTRAGRGWPPPPPSSPWRGTGR